MSGFESRHQKIRELLVQTVEGSADMFEELTRLSAFLQTLVGDVSLTVVPDYDQPATGCHPPKRGESGWGELWIRSERAFCSTASTDER